MSTDSIHKFLCGVHWEEGKKIELEKLAKMQAGQKRQQVELAQREDRRSNWEKAHAAVTDPKVYKDDFDPGY